MARKENPVKKTSNAQLEASAKYNAKTYTRYYVSLRKIDDADILSALDELFSIGFSTSEAFKLLIREGIAARKQY